jgi:hypothetical protein
MYAHMDDLRGHPGHAEDSRDQAGSPRAAGPAGLFGSLPFRQLAGPAAVFFFWPPTHARTAFSRPRRARPDYSALLGHLQHGTKDRDDLVAAQALDSFG